MALNVNYAGEVDARVTACASDNPCEAAWQAAYAYAADQAYDLAVFQALQGVIFAGLQYASADRTADLQYDIADRQMVIAEEEYQRYKDHYVECEDNLAAEICAMECPAPDYSVRADRSTRDVRREFSLLREKLERSRRRYCMSDQLRVLYELDKAEALAVLQGRDVAYRYAEKRHDYLDERRWTRRVVILQHGRNIMSGQSQMYNSAAGLAASALQAAQDAKRELFGTLSGAVGSVLNANTALNLATYNNGQYQTNANTFISGGAPTPGAMTVSGIRAGNGA